MRSYLILFFALLAFSIQGQERKIDIIKVKKSAEKEVTKSKTYKKVYDTTIVIPYSVFLSSCNCRLENYIKGIPGTCKDISYTVSGKYKGYLKTINGKGLWFSPEIQITVNDAKIGDKIFIENIKSPCFKASKKNYIIKIGQ